MITAGRATGLDARLASAVGNKAPGAALLVVGPEGVRARAATGLADVRADLAMSTDLQVPWFSMTKLVTATAALRLSERGGLDLDEPLRPLVPAMKALRPLAWAERITARHLLQHGSGLANPIPIAWIHPAGRPGPDLTSFLEGLLKRHPQLRSEPGTRASYSNVGTLLLGSAIERLTGQPFEAVIRKEILEPVGMRATSFAYQSDLPASTGYHPRLSPLRLLVPRWVRGQSSGRWLALQTFLVDGAPYGGLVGTAEDAARFLQMHLNGGAIDGVRVISEASAERMRETTLRGPRFDLGLGWFVPAKQRSVRPGFIEHLGGGAGFFNVMRIYPALQVGAVVMGNATNYDIDAAARLAIMYRDRGAGGGMNHFTETPP